MADATPLGTVLALGNDALAIAGALSFGVLLGWVTHRTVRRQKAAPTLADVGTVATTLLGAAITAVFQSPGLFGAYGIGLAIGFFWYLRHAEKRETAWKKAAQAAIDAGKPLPVDAPESINVDLWMNQAPTQRGPTPPP